MASRLSLQAKLETIMGSRHVYFQPPESLKMQYPCIRYRLSSINTINADDNPWRNVRCYELTLIDKNPDSAYIDSLMKLPMIRFGNSYASDSLNHYTFTLYY